MSTKEGKEKSSGNAKQGGYPHCEIYKRKRKVFHIEDFYKKTLKWGNKMSHIIWKTFRKYKIISRNCFILIHIKGIKHSFEYFTRKTITWRGHGVYYCGIFLGSKVCIIWIFFPTIIIIYFCQAPFLMLNELIQTCHKMEQISVDILKYYDDCSF